MVLACPSESSEGIPDTTKNALDWVHLELFKRRLAASAARSTS